jgi:hypothetical protein
MQELKELINFVSKNRVKRIEILGHPSNYESLYTRLYEGIATGQINSNEDALQNLYPGDDTKDQKKLNRLKSKLKEKLFNTILFIDSKGEKLSDFQKAYYSCHRDYVMVKILLGKNARKFAIPIAEQTLKTANKYEMTDITIFLSDILRRHHGTITGNIKKYKKYEEVLKRAQKNHTEELIAEQYYLDLAINYVNSRATKEELEIKAVQYYDELMALLTKEKSYKFLLYSYNVFVLRFQIENNYKETISICNDAVKEFEKRKHISSDYAIYNFLFYTLRSCIPLKLYTKGEEIANKCFNYIPEGSTNWFATMEQYLILSFHSEKFQKAFSIYNQAISNPGFNSLPTSLKEYWYIHEAFIYFLLKTGRIPPSQLDKQNKLHPKFRLRKFLNEVPTFSKDKRGTNITIIILQILFLLQERKYPQIIDRMESLNVYCHRYLRKNDTFRSNCFIKMLLQLPPARFNQIAVSRKAKKYTDRLNEVPINLAKQSNEIELVPYEILWSFVLESLDNKFH